jgi:predicted RNase H-like HicB family nuclease
MPTIDDLYIKLAKIYAHRLESEKLSSDLQKLVEAGKSREEAILTLSVKEGMIVRELRELVKTGKSEEEAISEAAKMMKINPETEEEVKSIEKEALKKHLFGIEEESPEPQIPPPTSLIQRVNFRVLLKYFVHGVLYSVLGIGLLLVWAGILLFLMTVGSILGLIIGLGVFVLLIGGLNSIITFFLWFPVKMSFLNVFFHGLTLSIALLFVNVIFLAIPNLVFPGIPTMVITTILGAFLSGVVGKVIAGIWREEE